MKKILKTILSVLMFVSVFNVNVKLFAYSTTKDFSNEGYSDNVNPYPLTCYGVLANCTWYVWGRAYEKGYTLPSVVWGNAEQWLDSAKLAGYETSMTPKTNSIAVWTTTDVGHVAYVESVSGNNVTISESNVFVEKGGPILRYHSDTYTANALKTRWGDQLIGYIHLTEDTSDIPTLTTGVGSIFDSSVLLKWTNGSEYQSGYWIRRATSADGPWTVVKEISGGSTHTWIDTSVSPGQRYWYTVQPYNSSKKGGTYSNKSEWRTLGDLSVNINISDNSENTQINLVWGNTLDYNSGYFVKRATSPNGPWTIVADLSNKTGDVKQWTDNENILPGRIYYYSVQPYNSSRVGGPHSNIVLAYAFDERTIEPSASKRVGNKMYELYDFSVSWQEAKKICERLGGNLATITSANENDVIVDLIKSGSKNFYCIGAESENTKGTWRWVTGENFEYNNWDTQFQEGNNSSEQYAYIIALDNPPNKQTGEWVDGIDKNISTYNFYHYVNVGFICEREIKDITFDLQGGKISDTYISQNVSHVNGNRAGLELVVYDQDNTTVNTNTIGYEVAVDDKGKVVKTRAYGENTQLVVPKNGMVVSGQYNYSEPSGSDFTGKLSLNHYVGFNYDEMKVYSYFDYDAYLVNHKFVCIGSTYGVLPVPKKEGYYFVGWYTAPQGDSSATQINYDSEYQCDTLYAHWEKTLIPDVISRKGNIIYEVYDKTMTWEDARDYCENIDSHLVTITSELENEIVTNLISNGKKGYYILGAESLTVVGEWNWVNKESFIYSNWDTDVLEGASSTERYAYIIAKECPPNKEVGEWVDGYNVVDFSLQNGVSDFYYYENVGFVCEGSVTKLKNLIKQVKNKDESKYTTKSYNRLVNVLNEAEQRVDSNDVTLAEVDSLCSQLTTSMQQLEEKSSIKIEKVENVIKNDINYKDVVLSWDSVQNANYYIIEQSTDNKDFNEYGTVVDNKVNVSLKTGKKYYFRIKAVYESDDDVIQGPWSENIFVQTKLQGVPKLSLAQEDDTRFKLKWSKIEGATRYIIYRKPSEGSYKKVLTLGKDDTSYITNVMAPGTYYFIIKAGRYDSVDRVMTDGSNVVHGKSVFTKPSVILKKKSSSEIKISWDAVDGVKYYEIYRSTSKNGTYKKIKTTTSLYYVNSSLKKGKTYFYKVKGYRSFTNGKVYTPYSTVKYISL